MIDQFILNINSDPHIKTYSDWKTSLIIPQEGGKNQEDASDKHLTKLLFIAMKYFIMSPFKNEK